MSIANLEIPRATRAAKVGDKSFLKGEITAPQSAYNPSKEVKERTADILNKKFARSYELMHRNLRELNDKSVVTATEEYQKLFNNYRAPKSTDADDAWKSNAIRPILRNRAVSIAAHVTATLIQPQIFAQNDQSKEDKDAEVVMRDLMEWADEQAGYVKTFVYAVIAAIINPISIIHTEYAQVYRTIKEMQEDGGWKEKSAIDEDLSGFRDTLVPPTELFIADLYEPNIQRQPYLFWRRAIDWNIAYAKYGDNANFTKYVRPGLQVVFDQQTNQFYELYDETLQDRLVEECIYYDRFQDLELHYVNGVLMDDPDRPNPRLDKRYPFAVSGYELIGDGRCFYYFPLVRKMMDDAEIVNTLYRAIIDGKLLQLMPPVAVFGDEAFTSSIVTPGTITTMGKDTKIQPINISNPDAGFNVIEKVEASISESSNDVLQAGASIRGPQTAFEISRLEQNAHIMLGLFGKMVGFLVKQLGELRISDVLQFLTVAEISELAGDDSSLTYRSFLLSNRTSNGRVKTRRLQLQDLEVKNPLEESYKILEEEGGLDSDTEIYKVNPALFRELKFKVIVRPETITPPSDALKKALNLELFAALAQLPFVDLEQATRDLLLGSYDATKQNPDKYIKKQQPTVQPGAVSQPEVVNKLFGTGQGQDMNAAVGQSVMERSAM